MHVTSIGSVRPTHERSGINNRLLLALPPATLDRIGGRIYLYPARLNHPQGFWCLNFTCGCPGQGSAVLIRSFKPLWGLEVMKDRRIKEGTSLSDEVGAYSRRLCNGPGVLWESLGWIDPELHNGKKLIDATLKLYRGENETPSPMVGARILREPNPNSYALDGGEQAGKKGRMAESPQLTRWI
jgi:Methylpurine-DNA glycosylase (MPG)